MMICKSVDQAIELYAKGIREAAENMAAREPSGRTAFDSRGNGYDGYSMSNNAVEAYENGEMPLSKWSKSSILAAVAKIDPAKASLLSGLKLSVLRKHLLYNSSWHHTSKMYNKTEFYAIDEDVVSELSDDMINEWTASIKRYKADILLFDDGEGYRYI